VQQLANQAVETDTATRIEVGRLHRHLAESLRALEAADLTRAAAHERLRIAKDRYGTESILAEDLLSSQAKAAEADRQYYEALATFWTARADYERVVGEDP